MASYPKRDLKYFRDVVGLPAKGIDPDDLQDEHVTESECIEVWGPRRPMGGFQFKTTHPDRMLNHRIEELWSIIYRLEVHEFGLRFGKAILAEKKGIPINWASFAVKTDGRRKSKRLTKMVERTISSINVDIDSEVPQKKHKVNMQMEKEEVGNDNSMSMDKNQINNNKEDEGKMSMMTPKPSQDNHPRLDEELHGPTTSMPTQYKTNINKEDEVKGPITQSKAQQVEAQRVSEAIKDHLDLISNHPRLDEKLQGLTTSISAYESLLHCTIGSRANLEKNIEDALSTCMTCKVAIAAYDNLCSQQDIIDEAIIDSTHRLRDIISHMKTNKEVGGVKGNKDALYFSIELEDATLWHDDLLEEKMATTSKIEIKMKGIEEKKNQLKVANQELLGLLLQYYKLFGKECNVLDSMQKQLELLQHGFYELKTLCDSGGVDGY